MHFLSAANRLVVYDPRYVEAETRSQGRETESSGEAGQPEAVDGGGGVGGAVGDGAPGEDGRDRAAKTK